MWLYEYSVLVLLLRLSISFFFFFNDTATTEIYTLSLHDALPIFPSRVWRRRPRGVRRGGRQPRRASRTGAHAGALPFKEDRKSTRLNSSHVRISYAVFCLKKKNRPQPVSVLDRPTWPYVASSALI